MTQVLQDTDRSHDIWHGRPHSLDPFFKPNNIAVIGASERKGSVGRSIYANLIGRSMSGAIFPINPKRSSILGVKTYPDLSSVPDSVDLAVIITPAPTIPPIIRDCVKNKVKAAIIISAGFKEIGAEGLKLENEIREAIKGTGLCVIGPNCLGLMNPLTGLNATFASRAALPGSIGFISQSGALCTAILD